VFYSFHRHLLHLAVYYSNSPGFGVDLGMIGCVFAAIGAVGGDGCAFILQWEP
jgi:hypothetical protein